MNEHVSYASQIDYYAKQSFFLVTGYDIFFSFFNEHNIDANIK